MKKLSLLLAAVLVLASCAHYGKSGCSDCASKKECTDCTDAKKKECADCKK